MEISFDPIKSFKNELQRQLSFEEVADFEWNTAVLFEDIRKANLREVKQYEEKIEILKKEAASKGEAANEQRW